MSLDDKLTAAVLIDDARAVDDLLSSGCHPDGSANDGEPLKTAARKNNQVICRRLLQGGARATVDRPGYNLPTALHQASFYGMMDATLTLMAWGASTLAKNTEGKSPFDVSDGHNVRTRMTAIRRILVFPLHAACEMGAAPECIRLLEQGWDPLALNARNQTPQRLARLNFRDEVDHIMQSWLARHRALAALDDALGGGHGPGEPGRRTVSL